MVTYDEYKRVKAKSEKLPIWSLIFAFSGPFGLLTECSDGGFGDDLGTTIAGLAICAVCGLYAFNRLKERRAAREMLPRMERGLAKGRGFLEEFDRNDEIEHLRNRMISAIKDAARYQEAGDLTLAADARARA